MKNINLDQIVKDIQEFYLKKNVNGLLYISSYLSAVINSVREDLINTLVSGGPNFYYEELKNKIAELERMKDRIYKLIDKLGRCGYFNTNQYNYVKEKKE